MSSNKNWEKILKDGLKKRENDWNVKGILTESKNIYSIGNDSKLVGRIFEIIVHSVLNEIARENNCELVMPDKQNTYPDYTFIDKKTKEKIAVDIKTTYYESSENRSLKFTLGSYASYMRDDTKNILYPYHEYSSHYVIGFIYERQPYKDDEGKTYPLDQINSVPIPYDNVSFFVKEKYKLSGDKPGSGNTENIGSFSAKNPEEFSTKNGPFSILGEKDFNEYWSNYPKYRDKNEKLFTNIHEYYEWKKANEKLDKEEEKLFKKIANYNKK